MSESGSGSTVPRLESAQRRQLLWITASAVAIFVGLRLLPTGTNLSHMDFRVDAKGTNAIEFCDPLNPQFIPVVSARSPIEMTLVTSQPAAAGSEVEAVVTLRTASGKPIVPQDLLVTHTRRLHLLLVDPTLSDYQHVHPEPTKKPGEWSFTFTPQRGGTYRVFGDFTPAATARGLYSSVDLPVAEATRGARSAVKETGASPDFALAGERGRIVVERDGYRFSLVTAQAPARAGQPLDLRFSASRGDGGPVPLEPVMGAFAHLVAFDETRSGFAHLHPAEADLAKLPDRKEPSLSFKLTIPRAGHYVVWAQVNLGGREQFVPFALQVE